MQKLVFHQQVLEAVANGRKFVSHLKSNLGVQVLCPVARSL